MRAPTYSEWFTFNRVFCVSILRDSVRKSRRGDWSRSERRPEGLDRWTPTWKAHLETGYLVENGQQGHQSRHPIDAEVFP